MSSDFVNPCVQKAEYAVRGFIVARSEEIKKELAAGVKKPFDHILQCNIGNPQAVGQKPFTFNRLVMACVDAPCLLENPTIVNELPKDVVARAHAALNEIGATKTGAYTNSKGYEFARKDAAFYITKRDRTNSGNDSLPESDPEKIVLTDGSSAVVRMVFPILLAGKQDGCMIPIPQYPLYSATMSLLGATPVPYYLRESEDWSLNLSDLESSYNEATKNGVTPRIIVVINPGNPTGQVLDRGVIEQIIKFAHDRKMLIFADEVYQENIYASGAKFHSFREVLLSLPEPYKNNAMLISTHTVSKGIIGECGRRGGYFERINIPGAVDAAIIKMISINLCANVNGQLMVSLMCRPPQKGDASYESYMEEYNSIFSHLKHNAELLTEELNTIPGFSCNKCSGAMYGFPKISLPAKFVAYNEEMNQKNGTSITPDTRFCVEFLEESGIVVVPGSGFRQEAGTYHFRTTILPPHDEMKRFVKAMREFSERIHKQYA